MNIVIFASADFPEGPATTSRIKMLSRIMVEAGHDVSLAFFFAPAKKPIPGNSAIEGIFGKISYRYLNGRTSRPEGFLAALADTLKGVFHSASYLREKIRNNACDMVIFYTPDSICIWPSLLTARRRGIPVVLELCEVFSSDVVTGVKNKIKRTASRVTEKILPKASSGVLVISTGIMRYLEGVGVEREKMLHLPILVDFERYAQSPDAAAAALPGKRYFLNSGSLCEKEGIESLMEAFALVAAKHGDICLAFTGDPSDARKAYALNLARGLNVDERIVFTGFLPVEQLVWAYRHAEALICCRSDTAYANYGFPTKLAEYLCSGRPVVTNDVGDVRLYLRDAENAFITRADDAVNMAEIMERILSDPSHADRVGAMGRLVALEHFDYTKFIKPVDTFLQAVRGGA